MKNLNVFEVAKTFLHRTQLDYYPANLVFPLALLAVKANQTAQGAI